MIHGKTVAQNQHWRGWAASFAFGSDGQMIRTSVGIGAILLQMARDESSCIDYSSS